MADPEGDAPFKQPPEGETPAGQPAQPWLSPGQTYGQLYGQPYPAGQPYDPPIFPPPTAGAAHYSLAGLAAALTVLLGASAAANLTGTVVTGGLIAAALLYLPVIPVFLVWFYRARKNADGRGQKQGRSPGWAIGAWFIPFANLVLPFQIMLDIWRANQPEERRSRATVLPGFWWGCWIGGGIIREVASRLESASGEPARGLDILADLLTAAAAILLVLIVRAVTRGPVGRAPVTAGPGAAPQDWLGPGPAEPDMPWPGPAYPLPASVVQGGRRSGVAAGYTLSALAVVAVAAVTAAILVPLGRTTPAPAPTPTAAAASAAPGRPTPAAHQVNAQQLRAGQCIQGPADINTATTWPSVVSVVPCTVKHLAEVFYSGNYWPAAMTFPTNAVINHQSNRECRKVFLVYDGISYSGSQYSYYFLAPAGQADWNSGDRLLTCVAYLWGPGSPRGMPLYASIKGSFG